MKNIFKKKKNILSKKEERVNKCGFFFFFNSLDCYGVWGGLVGCRLWGRTELDKTEAT